MNEPGPAGELEQAYEVLRAQAIGTCAPATPRGLALVLASGLVAWMAAWARPAPPKAAPPPVGGPRLVLAGLSVELVSVLAEMALGGQRRVAHEPRIAR